MSEENTGEVAEPTVAPEAEAPLADAPLEGAEGQVEAAPEPDAPAELTADQKAIKKLEGRVGFKTKELNAAQAAIAERDKQLETYKALLEAGKAPGEAEVPPAKPSGERMYSESELDARAEEKAAAKEFNKQADEVYAQGMKDHPDTFEDAVDHLNSVGLMTIPLLEAAMATEAAPEIINYLGNEPDEAARIAGLAPVRLGVELAKLAGKLAAPKLVRTSSAPAPIVPLGGVAKAEVNIYDPKILSGDKISPDYIAARAKQGFAYARPAKDRSV